MMNQSHLYTRFVPITNHSAQAGPDDTTSHVQPLPVQHYILGHQLRAPSTHFAYPAAQHVSGSQAFVPALEFCVPLLPRTHSLTDFQSGMAALTSLAPSWYTPLHTRTAPDATHHKSADTSVAIGVPLPVAVPVAISATRSMPAEMHPSVANTLADAHPAFLHTTASPAEDIEMKEETSVMPLQDCGHSEPPSLTSRAIPPPILARNSPDLLGSSRSPPSPISMHTDRSGSPSAMFLAPIWSPPHSLPPLSYEDFSGSEGSLSMHQDFELGDLSYPHSSSSSLPTLDFHVYRLATPPLSSIHADVNMRRRAFEAVVPQLCVNPADVMTDSLRPASPGSDRSDSPESEEEEALPQDSTYDVTPNRTTSYTPEDTSPRIKLSPAPDATTVDLPEDTQADEEFPDEAISAIVSLLKGSSAASGLPLPEVVKTDSSTLPSQSVAPQGEIVAPQPLYPRSSHFYNDRGVIHPSLNTTTNNVKASGPISYLGNRVPLADLPIPQPQQYEPIYAPYSASAPIAGEHYSFAPPPPQAPQQQLHLQEMPPVLNAHVGISLEELRQRAAEYRMRHEAGDLDKVFLQCFAGRLSARGELLEDYRCYVNGCGQRNKRRDHILVHVGSHVEHRPWACQHCGMRFLRKNECKRHESSHEGLKPYSCELCAPHHERSFVRQDLLRRHLRITHGLQGSNGRRKKASAGQVREDAEYWP